MKKIYLAIKKIGRLKFFLIRQFKPYTYLISGGGGIFVEGSKDFSRIKGTSFWRKLNLLISISLKPDGYLE